MTVCDLLFGTAIGGLAALVHLIATRRRAALATRGGVALAMATLPLAVAAPAACILAGILLWPAVAWAPLLGFWTLRSCGLAWLGRR